MTARREFLKFLGFGGAAFFLFGHTPYRQWVVYRSHRLLIVAGRAEPEAFPLTERLVGDLLRAIPESKAEAARTPTLRHITRLLLSRQIPLAVVTAEQAELMFRGEGEGRAEGPVPLRVLAFLQEPYVLVSHVEYDRDRAYLVVFGLFDGNGSQALSSRYRTLATMINRSRAIRVPLHSGTFDFLLEIQAGAPPS